MNTNVNPLGTLTPEQFLKDYWQKKTLVIRNAFPDFESPITPEELAGLSCEEEVNSRIVIEKDGDHPWQPIYGPMDDDVFAHLPETHWTLLVNDVEKHIPELAWIVDQFRFIPEWRMDDLMISYAPEGGSVGPHMDLYDVFILQARGHRRWQINAQPVAKDNQVSGTPLRIQKDFIAEDEWLMEPGDIIYIPPGVSHYGVATDDCMSFSIGFRATSHADLVNDFIGQLTQNLDASLTYRDPDLKIQNNPNEITTDAIERVRTIFKEYLDPNNPQLAEWFGRFVSDTKTDMTADVDEIISAIAEINDTTLMRNPASRFAFIKDNDNAQLFIDGDCYTVTSLFTETLCKDRSLDSNTVIASATEDEQSLLIDLINNGKLIIEDD
ncbi:MAG: cupin domain-containing protein [Gammaproteobacteria bacterium]|nr:cupin domain-containing protein [Gammaproteobacteria bacterium]